MMQIFNLQCIVLDLIVSISYSNYYILLFFANYENGIYKNNYTLLSNLRYSYFMF